MKLLSLTWAHINLQLLWCSLASRGFFPAITSFVSFDFCFFDASFSMLEEMVKSLSVFTFSMPLMAWRTLSNLSHLRALFSRLLLCDISYGSYSAILIIYLALISTFCNSTIYFVEKESRTANSVQEVSEHNDSFWGFFLHFLACALLFWLPPNSKLTISWKYLSNASQRYHSSRVAFRSKPISSWVKLGSFFRVHHFTFSSIQFHVAFYCSVT